MKALGDFGRRLLHLKNRLPWNGDWIFVTQSPLSEEQIDAADGYQDPQAILDGLSGPISPETAKLIYERAKAGEATVNDIANRTYDKAKVIFGAASFASTIVLALGTTLLPPLLESAPWLRITAVVLSLFLVFHLGQSIVIAAEVMTRNLLVRETPGELFNLRDKQEVDVLRELTAKILGYSLQTQTLGREKLNRLINAQHSFRYALIYYFILASLSITIRVMNFETSRTPALTQELKTLQREVELLGLNQKRLASIINRLEREQISSQRALRESIDLRNAQLDVLRSLERRISSQAVPTDPPATGKRP